MMIICPQLMHSKMSSFEALGLATRGARVFRSIQQKGTLIFRANLDRKVQKPIWRGARTIALHPEFIGSPLDCKVFLLKA
jgi:hypothetical protein